MSDTATLHSEVVERIETGVYTPVVEAEFPQAKVTTYIRFKYVIEYLLALTAVIVLSPLLLLIAAMVKLDSHGPILFRQSRFGHTGRKFDVLKFRTMVNNAHEMQKELQAINEMDGGGLFKSDKDPRVTRIGRFLRKFSLDELPQLFNILRGDMTIIGPRPLSSPIHMYEAEELKRFAMKPGLGCIWQAHFRRETDFRMWMKTDCIYVDSVSWQLDLKLLVIIAINTIRGKGAR